MPRKAKEKIEEVEKNEEVKDNKKKKGVAKKSATKAVSEKKATTKKATATKKVDTPKKETTKKSNKVATAKKSTSRKSTLAKIIESAVDETVQEKKSGTKTKSEKKDTKKTTAKAVKNTTEKKAEKKSTVKKSTSKNDAKKSTEKATKKSTKSRTQKSAEKSKESVQILEYYDLPYKYGNTVVRLLAQTPKTLFVYWEVSDSDIETFKKSYGDDFFNKTKPILIVHNLTLNKTTEIEINDFANCWYLNTDDTDCKFDIELARKFIDIPQSNENESTPSDYLYIAQSNNLQSPNNHILFEKIQEFVVFRNANNNNVIKKNIKSFKFLKDIYKFYKDMYDEEVLNNPSSQFKF